MSLKFKPGDPVYHNYTQGHGPGTVIRMNDVPASSGSFYNMDRYPYYVRFVDGYQDVYAECDLISEAEFKKRRPNVC